MGLLDGIKGQFLDVIEFQDVSNKLIVYKFQRDNGNNELKQNSNVIVREGQAAAFVKGGKLADILSPGTYSLKTDNFPILTSLKAFPFLFTSPVISDVFFISTKQFFGNKWATKNPVIKRDAEFNMVRMRAFGQYAFHIVDVSLFMREVFGSKGLVLTYEIVEYLSALVVEAFADFVGKTEHSILDLASEYRTFGNEVKQIVNMKASLLGIEFTEIIMESISLPEEVEKLLDEQSGIGMAKQDMETFIQYQSARAMRDAAKQKGGLAGLGAGMALGNTMVKTVSDVQGKDNTKSKTDQLRELKSLLDDGILTQEEFESEKKKILSR